MERTKRHDLWFFVVLCSLCLGLFDECVFYISSSSSHIVDRLLSLLSLHIVHNTRKSMDWRNPKESKDCNYVSFWKIEFLSRLFHSFPMLCAVCVHRILSLHPSSYLIWCDLWLSLSSPPAPWQQSQSHSHTFSILIIIINFTVCQGELGRFCMAVKCFSGLIKPRL